ncbi:MAG TPA: PEP-CTERM sorting domain-containing protein [Bryobacteraceae bacterium]|nr:PEP-CTERM sorting domain-containing protein [Bryobacteraceae bacterium]
MHRLTLVLIATLTVVSSAMAGTTCPSGGYDLYSPQAIGTLTGSITCATNNLGFSEFQFGSSASGGASTPTPSSITVTPQTTLGDEGFTFSESFIEGVGQSQDANILFEVTAAPGTTIDDLFIFFNGTATGNGAVSFSETYCTTSFSTGCNTFSTSSSVSQHIDITPTTHLFITKDFGANGGTDGTAHVSLVQNNFSNVPEPSQIGFVLAGMVGLFFARRKVRGSAA